LSKQDFHVPNCGLYKTTRELSGPQPVSANVLVMFHNHSDAGPPVLQLTAHNAHNVWHFGAAIEVTAESFLRSMKPLKAEGFYRLREHFHPDDKNIIAPNQLVQLGYNQQGDAIIFFPQRSAETNALLFPQTGMKIPDEIYELLEPLDLRGPYEPQTPHIH